MKFPFNLFPKKTNNNTEYIFGLLLKEQEGIGIVMVRSGNNIALKTYEKFSYSNGWENLTLDVDDLLFKIEQSSKIHLTQSIIFIFSHLIDDKSQEIKKPYLTKIKEMVKNLELKALGYIECYEAVVQINEDRDEMPLSAVVLELDRTQVSIFIYKSGHIAFSQSVTRTDNLVDDFVTVIDPVKKKLLLPARIILYDSKDMSEESTKFLSHRWTNDYFVQMPRIKIIQEEEIIAGLLKVFEKQIQKEDNKITVSETKDDEKSEVMGFAIGEDILEQKDETPPEKTFHKPLFSFNFGIITGLFKKIKLPATPTKALKIPAFVLIIIGLGAIIIPFFLSEYVLHKADITVYLPSQKINDDLTLNAGIDEPDSDLSITIATVSADMTDSKTASGKRSIGEKAKGEVTLHSFDDNEKTFAKGTILTTGPLKFLLDNDVKVASSSLASDGSAKLPGKTKANVTASDIGAEGNISQGKRFSIADYSSSIYFAINDKSFGGGSKKEITTVSKQDVDDLQNSLLNKAKNSKELLRQSSQKEKIVSALTSITLTNLQPSKETGEEASEISLKTKATATYYLYNDDKIYSFIINNLNKKLNSGYSLKKENINYSFSKVELGKNGSVQINLVVHANALKDIPIDLILKSVNAKSASSLDNILKNTLHAEGYKVKISHPILMFKSFMPVFRKNINLTISSL